SLMMKANRYSSFQRLGLMLSSHDIIFLFGESQTRRKSIGPLGKWKLSGIANMDQTPIEFDMCAKNVTYETRGAKTVWIKSSGSGLDKRQAIVQLTIFADGLKCVQPLIVFRGKGLRISQKEKSSWDYRVTVQFQDNAWTDKVLDILKECNTITALVPPGCTSLIQPLDVALNAQFKQ
ncbi:15676_t:CDS:2, partial [Acaulospora morrowiae]